MTCCVSPIIVVWRCAPSAISVTARAISSIALLVSVAVDDICDEAVETVLAVPEISPMMPAICPRVVL